MEKKMEQETEAGFMRRVVGTLFCGIPSGNECFLGLRVVTGSELWE